MKVVRLLPSLAMKPYGWLTVFPSSAMDARNAWFDALLAAKAVGVKLPSTRLAAIRPAIRRFTEIPLSFLRFPAAERQHATQAGINWHNTFVRQKSASFAMTPRAMAKNLAVPRPKYIFPRHLRPTIASPPSRGGSVAQLLWGSLRGRAMKNWLTIGMSKYETPGFEDTSRFMTRAFPGRAAYVEPPRAFRAWRWLERPVATWQTRTVDEVDVYTPPLPVPGRIDPLRLTLRLQAARLHRRLAARWGERWRDETIVYVTNWTPYQQRFISLLGPRYVVFDLVDDVLSFPYQMDEAAVWQAWRKLAEAATAVLAVSPELVQMAETQLGVSAHLLPNGVDFERFQAPAGAVQWDAQRDEREGVPEDRGLSAGEGIREAAPS